MRCLQRKVISKSKVLSSPSAIICFHCNKIRENCCSTCGAWMEKGDRDVFYYKETEHKNQKIMKLCSWHSTPKNLPATKFSFDGVKNSGLLCCWIAKTFFSKANRWTLDYCGWIGWNRWIGNLKDFFEPFLNLFKLLNIKFQFFE